MDSPIAVEVVKRMNASLVIRLGECAVPVDAVETHKTQWWWNVDQTSLIYKHNAKSRCDQSHLSLEDNIQTL